MTDLGVTYAQYPTSGNPKKTTDVISRREHVHWRCWNCNETSSGTFMGRYKDDRIVNEVRRAAKAHAASCDI